MASTQILELDSDLLYSAKQFKLHCSFTHILHNTVRSHRITALLALVHPSWLANLVVWN